MKEILELLEKDILSEDFSTRDYVLYGVFAPLVLLAVCVLAEFINALSQ